MVTEVTLKKKNLTENLDSSFPLDRQERQVSSAVIKNHTKNVTV